MKVYESSISGNVLSSDAGKTTVSKDGFLKLLAAQLQHQDPLNAQDNTEYVAQMAQFSALEQMQNLNTSIEKLLVSQKFQEGSLMIGKTAKIAVGEDGFIDGEVSAVRIAGNQIYVVAGGEEYSIDDVYELVDKGSGQDVVQDS